MTAKALAATHDGQRPRVLVVEDEDNIALALEIVLDAEGYTHDRIADGTGALDHIRRLAPDLVVLDVMLPGVSGHEICQGIRMDPGLAAVKILMMSARVSGIERRKGLAMGADAYIAKPFDLAELRGTLRGLVGGAAA
jgi:DNA-binding response OmpR family regulator